MRKVFLLFFICFLQFCCKQKTHQLIPEKKKNSTQENSFFPVTQYIRGQLLEIDSLPVTPLKIVSLHGKDDSVWLKKKDIRIFSEPFLHPEIDSVNLKNLYTETSFLDQTINAFTFSYDPKGALPDSIGLKKWIVYIDPETDKIIRIYMVKESKENDINQTWQLTWTSGKWCKITLIKELPGKEPEVKEEKMIWDFNN